MIAGRDMMVSLTTVPLSIPAAVLTATDWTQQAQAAAKPRGGSWARKHFGPGPHPGTGTDQDVHGGGEGSAEHGAYAHVAPEWKDPGGIFDQWAYAMQLDKTKIVDTYAAELEAWRKEDPASFEAAKNWYRDGHAFTVRTAKKFGVTPDQVAGILSITSAESVWEAQNKAAADSLLAIFLREDPETTLDRLEVQGFLDREASHGREYPELAAMLTASADMGTHDAAEDAGGPAALFPLGENTVTLRLSEIPAAAMHLAGIWSERQDAGTIRLPRYYSAPIVAVAKILRGEDPWDVVKGFKQRSFMYNLLYPEDREAVTIDRWMLRAAAFDSRIGRTAEKASESYAKIAGFVWTNRAGKEYPVDGDDLYKMYVDGGGVKLHGVGRVQTDKPKTPGKAYNVAGAYPWHADWVEQVAKRTGLLPNETQALVWTLVRNRKPQLLKYRSRFTQNAAQAEFEED